MARGREIEVHYEVNGLGLLRELRDGTGQARPHSHNEIEVLFMEKGGGVWLMGGETVRFEARQLIAFWAVRPHQLIKSSKGTVINCLTIPLAVFTEWGVSDLLSKALLAGDTVTSTRDGDFDLDRHHFLQWHEDLRSQDAERSRVAILEIQARLGRLAQTLKGETEPASLRPPAPGLMNHGYFKKVSQIAEYVSRHYAEALTIPAIAAAVDMHPTSATKMFKKICGLNLIDYVTQHRLLHAQRLLATTDLKVLDVALASGYRSASRFYAAFKEACGVSPQDFRQSYELTKASQLAGPRPKGLPESGPGM